MESKKNGTNELIYKTEIESNVEDQLMATKGEKSGCVKQTRCTVPLKYTQCHKSPIAPPRFFFKK